MKIMHDKPEATTSENQWEFWDFDASSWECAVQEADQEATASQDDDGHRLGPELPLQLSSKHESVVDLPASSMKKWHSLRSSTLHHSSSLCCVFVATSMIEPDDGQRSHFESTARVWNKISPESDSHENTSDDKTKITSEETEKFLKQITDRKYRALAA